MDFADVLNMTFVRIENTDFIVKFLTKEDVKYLEHLQPLFKALIVHDAEER